jgi:hypothetical protein
MSPTRPYLATSVATLTRSFLFALGVDHVLIDFLAHIATGALAVLLAILVLAIRIPRSQPAGPHRNKRVLSNLR